MNHPSISRRVMLAALVAASLAGCSASGPASEPVEEEARTGGGGGASGGPAAPDDLSGAKASSGAGGASDGACTPGSSRSCYEGPVGTEGVGTCVAGVAACEGGAEFGIWGPCVGAVYPQVEACGSAADEDCDGEVDEECVIDVPVDIDGDCVTATCPPEAPYPVGCAITMNGSDSRGCVASTPASPVVYFQEGNKCDVGHVGGTLSCSSQQGAPLSEATCTLNKSDKYYPADPSGCP